MLRTGFIGLGSQGGPMAERMLGEGFPLTIWARRAEAAAALAEKGARVASSIGELGAACDHVGVCVLDDAAVSEVCEPLVAAMAEGSLLALHSTVLPDTAERIDARCREAGVRFLDAPVSGGGGAAEAKQLTVMCGGTEEAFDQARPVLESFAGHLCRLGAAGAGQRAKLVNNALMAATMGLSHAALSAGEALGIDRSALAALIKESSGRSFALEVYAALPSPGAFSLGAPLLAKDVGLLEQALDANPDAAVLAAAAAHFLDAATADS